LAMSPRTCYETNRETFDGKYVMARLIMIHTNRTESGVSSRLAHLVL
jgi:hypothetical protein